MYTAYLRYDATLMTLGLLGWIFWCLLCLSALACLLLRYMFFILLQLDTYVYATFLPCSGSGFGLAAPVVLMLGTIQHDMM